MSGVVQTVRCTRAQSDGSCEVAWERLMYVPHSEHARFIESFDGKTAGAFTYAVLFDAKPVSRKPRSVQRWTD